MTRGKVRTKKLPVSTREDAIESIESNYAPVQRTRGRPRKAEENEPTFVRFRELPEELRLKIWKLTLPGPRLVEIGSVARPRTSNRRGLNSNRSAPSILHVCSESRKEALKCYTAFPLGFASDPLRAVYVNFLIDTLYFSVDDDCSMSRHREGYGLGIEPLMNNVRFIAIRYTAVCARYDKLTMPFIYRCGKLEELTVVVNDVGTGDINDEHELGVWEEWQTGEVTGEHRDEHEPDIDYCLENQYSLERQVFRYKIMSSPDWQIVELMKNFGVSKNCCGILKNMQVRIVRVHRAEKQV